MTIAKLVLPAGRHNIWTQEGWLYLAVLLDLCSRRVVGWVVSDRLTEGLTLKALTKPLRLADRVEVCSTIVTAAVSTPPAAIKRGSPAMGCAPA